MEIEVLNNNTNMFPLHVATTLVAFLVTNHALKHVAKKAKTTSILISHKCTYCSSSSLSNIPIANSCHTHLNVGPSSLS